MRAANTMTECSPRHALQTTLSTGGDTSYYFWPTHMSICIHTHRVLVIGALVYCALVVVVAAAAASSSDALLGTALPRSCGVDL
jgi:hypothetical protein